MTDSRDIDALAAEYVLGTLDAAERAAVSVRRDREPALSAAIGAWERRLAPLAETAPPVAPPAHLLSKIERRIETDMTPTAAAVATNVVDLSRLQRRLNRWRAAAVAASAIAAGLLLVIGLRETTRLSEPQSYVAVFQKDDASPAFLMSVDLATRTLSVRRVAAEVPAGKTYQWWIAAEQLGAGPRSLGLVDDRDTVHRAIANIDPAIVQTALFGVSLEPAGGSPTGKPTGPVFHAKLIPSSP